MSTKAELKISGVTVVLVGAFTPTVFQPAWFGRNNLLAAAEAEAAGAGIDVVHPDVTNFHTDWLTVNVTRDRFTASCTKEESLVLLRDLVVGTFMLFPHAEVKALGINRNCHFQMDSEAAWHALGHKLVPKATWEALLKPPIGMLTAQVQSSRPDGHRGNVNVLVQPSTQVKFGTFVQTNDHFDFGDKKTPGEALAAVTILKEVWQDVLAKAEKVAYGVVSS